MFVRSKANVCAEPVIVGQWPFNSFRSIKVEHQVMNKNTIAFYIFMRTFVTGSLGIKIKYHNNLAVPFRKRQTSLIQPGQAVKAINRIRRETTRQEFDRGRAIRRSPGQCFRPNFLSHERVRFTNILFFDQTFCVIKPMIAINN